MASLTNLIRLILTHSADQSNANQAVGIELLEAAWPSLVGQEMARRTRPRAWHQGTLHIEVSSHAWVQELSFHREQLLERIQHLFPWPLERLHLSVAREFEPLELREDVEFLDVPRPERDERDERERARRTLDTPERERAERDLEQVEDEELRDQLRRIHGHIQRRDEPGD